MRAKEVFFHEFCNTCINSAVAEEEDPCNECLYYGSNIDSHKPRNYIPKKEYEKTKPYANSGI